MNEYEIKLVGDYQANNFELKDTIKKADVPNLSLKLNKDKSFVFTINKQQINGVWDANDYGDWTIINFDFNKIHTEGIIEGKNFETIEIKNPLLFDIQDVKSFSLIRVTK